MLNFHWLQNDYEVICNFSQNSAATAEAVSQNNLYFFPELHTYSLFDFHIYSCTELISIYIREAFSKKNLKSLEIFQTFRNPPPYSLEISQILGVFLGQPKTPRN